jgi:transcriptional regulator with XRE-family HTH domain
MLDARAPLVAALLRLFRVLRLDRGLTIEQLADAASVHRTTVGLLERGERAPSVEVASQVAKALGYPLSELLSKAELIADGKLAERKAFVEEKARHIDAALLRNSTAFQQYTGVPSAALQAAIQGCYHTLDMIDDQLVSRGSLPMGQLVELANLSSMIGNLVGGCLADESGGLYQRNKPHHDPDLLPLTTDASPLELKVALETNKPKGHLPKPGRYITFRYVLGDRQGNYGRGKAGRGTTVWFWEVKVGDIRTEDFAVSNTEGDSGKTAVVRTAVFNAMPVVYFDPKYCPHPLRAGTYPGFN